MRMPTLVGSCTKLVGVTRTPLVLGALRTRVVVAWVFIVGLSLMLVWLCSATKYPLTSALAQNNFGTMHINRMSRCKDPIHNDIAHAHRSVTIGCVVCLACRPFALGGRRN